VSDDKANARNQTAKRKRWKAAKTPEALAALMALDGVTLTLEEAAELLSKPVTIPAVVQRDPASRPRLAPTDPPPPRRSTLLLG
jgi:hypothetical protein